MSKKILIFLLLAAAIVTALYFLLIKKINRKDTVSPSLPTPTQQDVVKEINYKAKFDIYTRGTKRIFTDSRYHNKSKDVFIEPGEPNVVYVKKLGVTWSDFFKTLPMSLNKECLVTGTNQTFCTGKDGTLKFYINGLEDKDALDREIKDGDGLLVEYK